MLKMALQQFVSRYTLLTLLLCTGCPPAVLTDNSTLVDNVQPGNSPWMVYFLIYPPRLNCVGSLITDQWVITELNCVTSRNIKDTNAVLGIQNRTGDNPNAVTRGLADRICYSENINWSDSGICLIKLSSPVNFTHDIQPISLASKMSTFDNGTSAWGSVFEEIEGVMTAMIEFVKEVEASILNNEQCKSKQLPIGITQTEMCVIPGGTNACALISGSPVVTRVRYQRVLLGVNTFRFFSCYDPGIFTRVSRYQDWIHEVISGMEPTFVTVSSTGIDPDYSETTTTPIGMTTTTTTFDPTGMGTRSYRTTTHPTTTEMIYNFTTPDGSIFNGGNNLIHFTHFFSLSVLVLFLHVLVGGSEM